MSDCRAMIKVTVSGGTGQGRFANMRYVVSATFAGEPEPWEELWSTSRGPAESAMAHYLTELDEGPRLQAEEIRWVEPPVGGFARKVFEIGRRAQEAEDAK